VASVLTSAPDCETLRTQLARTNPRPNTDLATELKLTPGEAQAVAEIQQAQTVAGFCRPAAGSTDSPEQLQAQLMAILGPARFEQLQEFKTRLTTQQNMTTLTTQLKQSGAPLDSEQARQLSNTILEENRQTRREATMTFAPSDPYGRLAYEEENLKLTEERYARTLKAAQAYLRPEQLAQLRGNMTRQADAMRASVARIRASVEAGQGIPASGTVLLINGPVGATVSAPPR
jgi:hypothetical protein